VRRTFRADFFGIPKKIRKRDIIFPCLVAKSLANGRAKGLEESTQDLYEVLATPNETMLEVYVAAVPAFAHAEY
jgi:hypothetical protein